MKEAQKDFNAAYALGPQFSELATYTAEIGILAGDLSSASQILLNAKPGVSANTWFSLAAAYYKAGDTANAIQTINTAVARYPDFAATGAAAIKQIEGGRNDTVPTN